MNQQLEIVYALENTNQKQNSIFLAGPTYRIHKDNADDVKSWREDALEFLKQQRFTGTVYVPECRNYIMPKEWTFSRQVDWETECLQEADVILFWIPRNLETLPGFTTNIEFGEWFKSGKIAIGSPKNTPKIKYLKERCSRENIIWTESLSDCIVQALEKLKQIEGNKSKLWFTSDTHFSHERTRQLCKRPFSNTKDMDWTMVKKWNECVTANDTVYHLGDFGESSFIQHLAGNKIILIVGNYDTPGVIAKLKLDPRVIVFKETEMSLNNIHMHCIHAPEDANNEHDFYLFGHVHKLSMTKRNGLNVGVDCHDFCPIDMETVLFFHNAIINHYDKNVFMERLGD